MDKSHSEHFTILYIIVILILIITVVMVYNRYISRKCNREKQKYNQNGQKYNRNTKLDSPISIYQQYCRKAITYREPLTSIIPITRTKTKIPKIIIQTNEKSRIPRGMYDATNTILDHNPEYKYLYFDDKAARKYIVANYSKRIVDAYDKLIPGAYKADMFRYCILYKMGGVYIDMGMVAKTSLRYMIKPDDVFISPEDDGGHGLYNAFICCIPGHSILKNAIDICVDNIEKSYYGVDSLDPTGPRVLSKAMVVTINKHNGNNSDNDWTPYPDRSYGRGIRTIRHDKHLEYDHYGDSTTVLEVGNIHDGELFIFITKYPTYRQECKWYNTIPHYGILWTDRSIYNHVLNKR